MSLIIDYLKNFLLSNLGLFLQLAVCAMTAGLTLLLYRPVTRILFRLLRGRSSRARSSLPVSYTHLDVDKRQLLYRPIVLVR